MKFDKEALNWDDEVRIRRAKAIADEISCEIGERYIDTALEFGCGTGLISFNIYNRIGHIDLIDSSSGMISILKEKISSKGVTNMDPIFGDITAGDFLERKYDLIYTSMVLHHIVDIDNILRILQGLLNENGLICIVDLDEEDGSFHLGEVNYEGHNGFNQEELKSKLIKAGYKNPESRTFYRDIKIIGDVKVPYSLFIMTGLR